jgi:hypothetical protein
MDQKPIWYCVISTINFRMIYLGTGEVEARIATGPNTHYATASTLGEAQRIAAIEAGEMGTRARRSDT